MSSTQTIDPYNSQDHGRSRLKTILLATQFFLFLIVAHRLYLGDLQQAAIMGFVMLALSSLHIYANKGDPKTSASMFGSLCCLVMLYFMWAHEGMRDETMLAFPALFTFSRAHRQCAVCCRYVGCHDDQHPVDGIF